MAKKTKKKAKVKAKKASPPKPKPKPKAKPPPKRKTRPRRRRAYVVIMKKGRVLLVRNRRGRWTLPGGRANQAEKLRQTAKREVLEETGVKIVLGKRVSGNHVRHHRRPCTKCVVFEASIKKGTPKPKREIVEIAWVKPDKAPKKLRAYRRKEIRRLLAKMS